MMLPKSFTKITTFSKILTMSLFILFPFAGFYLGIRYQQSFPPKIEYITQEKVIRVFPTETPQSLISRCGDMLSYSDLNITADHFTRVIGPFWSPDCRHIVWSVWQSGPMGIEYKGPYSYEGLFLYDDRTKKIQKIYTPNSGETVEIKEWKDNGTVIFSKDGSMVYSLDITTNSVELLNYAKSQ
jgi:hypothetical protein